MSGYGYNNRRRRGRDFGPQGGGGSQNSSYWNTRHYNKYQNYNQFQFCNLTFPKRWNSVSWSNQNQYSDTHGRESVSHNLFPPRQPINPSPVHSKATGHSSSVKGQTLQAKSRNRNKIKKRRSSSSTRSSSFPQQKVGNPPPGSEEARKKSLAQATDKIKSCLLSFQNEKSEVLENLLSNEEQRMEEPTKAIAVRLEKAGYADLRLTPNDLKVIGMVNTAGTGSSLELEEAGSSAVETVSTNEFLDSSSRAEILVQNSNCSGKDLLSSDGSCAFSTCDVELLDNMEGNNICKNLDKEAGLKDSSNPIGLIPHCTYKRSRYSSETNSPGRPTSSENLASNPDPCAPSRSASLSISDAADDSNQSRNGTNVRLSYDNPSHNYENEPKRTLKNLKQRIIQQFLKMGKNNLKDLINNPRSRKFEFAMNHLMKEHRLLLSRELRSLAQSRIRGQDVENQGQGAPVRETSSLLDTEIAINLSHLPQEVIEQLGNLLQLDLLDNAESIDFQPITVDGETGVHDLQNIQALQVALLSEENIKREIVESEMKPRVGREASSNPVEKIGSERNLVEGQHSQLNRSVMDVGTGQIEYPLKREMENKEDLVLEEGGTIKKSRKESDKWPDYIPLGKGFMNRSGEFGNLLCELPDFLHMESSECEALGGHNHNVTGVLFTQETNREGAEHPQSEADQTTASSSNKAVSPNSASEAYEIADCNASVVAGVIPSKISNSEMFENYGKSLNNTSAEKSVIERFTTGCLTGTDIGVKSCSQENWTDTAQDKGPGGSCNTPHDYGTNFPASNVATASQVRDIFKGSAGAGTPLIGNEEPSGASVIDDGHVEGSADSSVLLVDNEDPSEDSAAADKPSEGFGEPTNALFEDNDNNVNVSVGGINEGVNIATNTAPNESEIKYGNFGEMKCETFVLPKENNITKEDPIIGGRLGDPSERMDSNSVLVGNHIGNLQTDLNTLGSNRIINSEINTNEETGYGVENKTFNKETVRNFSTCENQNGSNNSDVAPVNDPSSEAMDAAFVLPGNDTENTNCAEHVTPNKRSDHFVIAERSINSGDTAEVSRNRTCNETEISPSQEIQAEDINVDELYGDLNELSIAGDANNSAVGRTGVSHSADNVEEVVATKPVSEEAVEMDESDLRIMKNAVSDDGYKENHTAEASVQIEFSSSDVANSHEIRDEIMEIYHHNVVVKTEKIDDTADDRTSVLEEQAQPEGSNDIVRGVPELRSIGSLSHNQPSFISSPINEVTVVEVSTQTQPPDELDSDDVQRMLQLLEKSSQLSPQLAKLLKDHFSSRKITEENESSKSSNSVQFFDTSKDGMICAPKEKSPLCLIQPLRSAGSQISLACVSEIHNMDSAVETTLQHTSGLSYSMDGMERSFRGSSVLDNKEKKNTRKRMKLARPEETSTEVNRLPNIRVASKESEGTAGAGSHAVADTGNSTSAAAAISVGIDGGRNNDSMNPLHTRDVQEGSLGSNSKYVFLRMLEIDKEIQKLMEVKLELYRKLQLSLEVESSFTNRNNSHSPKSRGLQYANPTTVASPHTLCNKIALSNNSNTQQMHMGFVTMNNELTGNSFTSDRPTSTSTPMVMLPIDYVLGSSCELQNTHVSLPRHKLNECLKTFDTSVVEAVLNSFNLPDGQNREDSAVIHSSDHKQNKISSDANESKSGQVDSSNTNKGRRYVAHRFTASHRESHQSDGKSFSQKTAGQKKLASKPKHGLNKEHHSSDSKKHPHVQHKTRIARKNRLGNREKSWIESNSDVILRKTVNSDSLKETAVKELRSRRQTEIFENRNQQNEGSRGKFTNQKVGNMKHDKESLQSDSSVVEDKKETHSSNNTEVSTKNSKQSETDSSSSSNRPKRRSPRESDTNKSSEQFFSQTSNSIPRGRRDTKTRSLGDVELLLEDPVETISRRKETLSSTGGNSTSLEESEASDCTSRVTRKRKLTVKTEIIDNEYVTSSQEESGKPPMESLSRRSFSRVASAFQAVQPAVLDENVTEMVRKRRRAVKIEQTDAIDESTSPVRKLKKTTLSNSGQLQRSNNTRIPSSPGIVGTQKRKPNETESQPSKVQHHNPKMDLLQWNLQDCFVVVKPLAIEEMDESVKPCEKLSATNNLGNQRIRRSSCSSDELSVTQFVKKNKNEVYLAGQDVKQKLDNVGDCYRITFPELADEQLDPLGDAVIFPESADEQLNQTEGSSNQQDPLGDVSDSSSCQAQPPKLHIEPYGNITSSPMQLPPDLLMQSDSPGWSQGQCFLPEVATQDENSISTLVSDTLSVTSDGEQPLVKRISSDEKNETQLVTHSADGKDDCDQDSAYSYDMAQEGREGTNSRATKHKSSKKHRKDRKSDGIERLMFESHKGPILDIKTVGRHVLAASEDGNVYCYSLKSGKFKRKYEGHHAAVTCLCVIECGGSVSTELGSADAEQMAPDFFFTGSLDKHLRNFRFKTGELVQNAVDIGNPIQCMDQNCGIVYIGTQAGEVARFSIKTSALVGEPMKIGRESILTLKATKEGPRQVLIIGSRNKPIAVRDAATGLLLRTVCNNWSHTVYSLVLSTGLVYCGTKTGSIPAVEFTSGDEVCRFQAAASVVCMRIYNNLLFAGCYDGNIYVFSIHDKSQVSSIPGPGKMLLCMDIVKNRIIAGSKDSNKLEAWGFPQEIRNHLKEARHR